MLRDCLIDFKENWDNHLPFIEFSYSNSYRSSIAMTPFEALYGRRCRFPAGSFEVGDFSLHGSEIAYKAVEKVRLIREALKTSYSQQCPQYKEGPLIQSRRLGLFDNFTHGRYNEVWKERET